MRPLGGDQPDIEGRVGRQRDGPQHGDVAGLRDLSRELQTDRPHHRKVQREGRFQRRALASPGAGQRIDGAEKYRLYYIFAFTQQIGDQRCARMFARQGKTECLRL